MPHKRLGCTFVPSAPQQTWVADGGGVQMDLQAALERALAGHYQVIREIGRGGMAVVYECRDLVADRSVAIKLLYPDLARALGGERFLREIRILQQLNHPNILPLLDSGSLELLPGVQLPWYAMPLAREETLRARLAREGALPLATALGYARDLCAALTHAHGQGVIHRDIKPENVLLVEGRAVLADFGIARAITVAGGDTLSTTGIVVGTPAYMSPEQSTGARQLDGRSDLYSLGVVLYEMLAGHAPFSGSTPQAVSARHQFEAPPPIVVVRPGLPVGVTAVLERALAKLAPDRFTNAAELDAALATLPTSISSPRTRRWQRVSAVLGASVGAALLIGAVGLKTMRTDVASPAIAVIPFTDGLASNTLCGTECSALVDDALSQWIDFPKVDQMRVRNAVAVLGSPRVLSEAERVARSVGAGRFIFGEVYQVGTTLRLRLSLNQLQWMKSRNLGQLVLSISLDPDSLDAAGVLEKFSDAARELVAPDAKGMPSIRESLRTRDLAALRLKLRGDSSLALWDIAGAKRFYQEALARDSTYAQAALAIAQIGMWAGEETDSWSAAAMRADALNGHLTPTQARLASAAAALARHDFPESCNTFRQVVTADSLDFAGWFGLAECLARDNIVIARPASPSGFAFRADITEAMSAYSRALSLAPLAHVGYGGAAINRLIDRFYVEPIMLREGRTDHGDEFAAFAMLINGSLAFIPRPLGEVLAGRWPNEHMTTANAIGRERLLEVTRGWVRAFPNSTVAWESHATALEVSGRIRETGNPESSALDAISKARALPAGSSASLNQEIATVRLLVKLHRLSAAFATADSILKRVIPTTREQSQKLAGLAALLGSKDRTISLLCQHASGSSFPSASSSGAALDSASACSAFKVLTFAAMGALDSTAEAARQFEVALASSKVPRVEDRQAILDRATILAFPALGPPDGPGSYRKVERALARGDVTEARAYLDTLATRKKGMRPGDFSMDMLLLEARLRLAANDSAGAQAIVTGALDGWDTFGRSLVTDVPQAAAVTRMLRMADSLGVPLARDFVTR